MKTVIPILMVTGLWICCGGTALPQVEGKHLGSTQDVARNTREMYPSATVDALAVPETKTSGGKYGTQAFSPETGMYLDEQWQPGYAMLRNKTRVDGMSLRYDIYHQQMQFLSGQDTLAFSRPLELEYLFINGSMFIYTDYIKDAVLGQGYFEVLVEGECQLLLRRSVTTHAKEITADGSVSDEYQRQADFFIRKGTEAAFELKPSRNGVCDALSEHEPQIREFIRSNGLKMSNTNHLVEVVRFYNSLQ